MSPSGLWISPPASRPAPSKPVDLTTSRLAQFRAVGRDLFLRGLVSSHSGNLSVRHRDSITITRHSSQLGHLGKSDLVTVALDGEIPPEVSPSMELPRHRAIYGATSAWAIVLALSLLADEIAPRDLEGAYLLGKVPVVEPEDPATEGLAQELARHPIAILRGHGSFAVGDSLGDALQWTMALEDSCLILLWLRMAGAGR